MPVTSTDWPILSSFLCAVSKSTGMPLQASVKDESEPASQAVDVTDRTPKKLPKGVVLGKDGKP